MRKNYFRQSLKAAVVLLTATMVMSSCGTQDNPIEEVINSTSTSSDYTLTSTGAQLYYNIDGIDYKVNAEGSLTAVEE